jgi:hypothetical protein
MQKHSHAGVEAQLDIRLNTKLKEETRLERKGFIKLSSI